MGLAAALEKEDLAIQWEKVHFWAKYRPALNVIRRTHFHAEYDLTFLGVVANTGWAPDMDVII